MIGELLHYLGVSGSIATLVSGVIALYHGRSILNLIGRLGVWIRLGGVMALVLLLAGSGVIPGVSLSIDFGTLWRALSGLYEWLPVGRLLSLGLG